MQQNAFKEFFEFLKSESPEIQSLAVKTLANLYDWNHDYYDKDGVKTLVQLSQTAELSTRLDCIRYV